MPRIPLEKPVTLENLRRISITTPLRKVPEEESLKADNCGVGEGSKKQQKLEGYSEMEKCAEGVCLNINANANIIGVEAEQARSSNEVVNEFRRFIQMRKGAGEMPSLKEIQEEQRKEKEGPYKRKRESFSL